jgi:hypothetical protein
MFSAIWQWIKSVNKKVWVTAAFLSVIFMVGMTWIIVINVMGRFKPACWTNLEPHQRQNVSGNGGPAVRVGDWLYFVGNYVDSSTIRYRQNEHNKVKEGAIYRVYIDPALGKPLYEDADRAGTDPDYTPHLLDKSKFQLIVPKVAGFENAALWVFDKHLIYTSPNNTKDKRGQLQLGRIDFFRVDLDGRNHRKIYTSVEDILTPEDFTVGMFSGSVFLLIRDGDLLRRVDVTGSRRGRVVTISKNVQHVVFPVVTSYFTSPDDFQRPAHEGGGFGGGVRGLAASYSGVMGYIYYTEQFLDSDDDFDGLYGNRLFQYRVSHNTSVDTIIADHAIRPQVLSGGRLVYGVSTAVDNRFGIGGESLGLFSTWHPIKTVFNDGNGAREFRTEPFDIALVGGSTRFMDDYRLLEDHYDPKGELFLPSVAMPGLPLTFGILSSGTLLMYEINQNEQDPAKRVNQQQEFASVPGVTQVITISGSMIYYLDGGGLFRAASLSTGVVVSDGDMGTTRPNTDIRPWVISGHTAGCTPWFFHIKNLEEHDDDDHVHDENCNHGSASNIAAIWDLSAGVGFEREFMLGRVDCRFVPGNHKDC